MTHSSLRSTNSLAIFSLFVLCVFNQCVLGIGQYTNHWPHFYESEKSTYPTNQILSNLTAYRRQWEQKKSEDGFGETYTFTFAWDCSPCIDECWAANKFIRVEEGEIASMSVSQLNDATKVKACSTSKAKTNRTDYKTIEQLWNLTISWCTEGLNDPQYTIIELVLDREYYFPMAVKLSSGSNYYAWDIPCFEPALYDNEELICEFAGSDSDTTWTFWISKEMQSFLGWSMIFLILVACSLGYCINWLKKKKSEKIEKWRQKEEKMKADREKEKQRKKDKKGKRRSSKAKNRAHLEKSHRNKPNINEPEHEYSSLQANDATSDDELLHANVVDDEQKHQDP